MSRVQPEITGVVLAGGRGRRMGQVDKGLQLLNGLPLVQRVLERFAPQVSEVVISANQNIERYQALGFATVADQFAGFAGPLAGLHAAMSQAKFPLIASVPCDTPFLPVNLVARLFVAINEAQADVAVARTFAQAQPVFCLCRCSLLPHLTGFLEQGGRKFDAWYATLNVVEVAFDDAADQFANINTRDELSSFEK
jgi:molybdopterin-guanine dinucleotide biosynthesis protein A